jgi:type I restriction enzyme S subunit
MQKNKNRPGYKKTKAGWIPEDWDAPSLGSITSRIGDGIHTTPAYVDASQYYFVNGNNLADGRVVISPETKCVSKDEYVKHKKDLDDCTLLLSINGTVGNVAYYRQEPVVLGKSAAYINCDVPLNKCFAFAFLASPKARRFYRGEWTGSTIKNLSLASIRQMPIPLPSLPEQEAIAEVLECWDKAIRGYERKIETKRNIKKGLMQRLLSGKQRLPGFDGEWKEVRLGELGGFSKGNGISKDQLSRSGVPCIRYGEIYTSTDYVIRSFKSFIPSEMSSQSTAIHFNDLLFAGSGETIEEIGKSIAYMGNAQAFAGGDVIILSLNERLARADYISFFLNTEGRRAINRLGQGQSVVHIYARYLKGVAIPLPPLPEQKAIAVVLSSADAEIAALERKLATLRDQKRFLLNNMMTGTIRLPQFVSSGAADVTTGDTE